jgi:hypothetical protein
MVADPKMAHRRDPSAASHPDGWKLAFRALIEIGTG